MNGTAGLIPVATFLGLRAIPVVESGLYPLRMDG